MDVVKLRRRLTSGWIWPRAADSSLSRVWRAPVEDIVVALCCVEVEVLYYVANEGAELRVVLESFEYIFR